MGELVPDFLRRSYQEIVRDTLTRLVGGVAGETVVYRQSLNHEGFVLERHPVAEVLRLAARFGEGLRDIPSDQVELIGDASRLRFIDDTALPDRTVVYVDYRPIGDSSPITDVHVGSVSRTLTEAISREMALFFAKLERVYRDAFVDTATGDALDQLVALLGLKRIRAGFPTVTLTFARATPAPGDIAIAAGTLVSTGVREDGSDVRFETVAAQVLKQGTREIDVVGRALADSADAAL
ncbi:MAG: hypothetical protein AAGC55_31790, partial [Myxococcota bacterium]